MDQNKKSKCDFPYFHNKLTTGNIYNLHVTDNGIVSKERLSNIKIVDCVFEGRLTFKKNHFLSNVLFEDCVFKDGVDFSNVEVDGNFCMRGCVIQDDINFLNTSCKQMEFAKCDAIGLIFRGFINKDEGVDGNVQIIEGNYEKIEFARAETNCAISFVSSQIGSLYFLNSKINQDVSITVGATIDFINIDSSAVHNRLDFTDCSIKGSLLLSKSRFNNQVWFQENCKINSLDLANIISSQKFIIDFKNNLEVLNISDSRFENNFTCQFISSEKAISWEPIHVKISGIIYGHMIFDGVPLSPLFIEAINFGNLIFNKVKTRVIILNGFNNHNKLTISNIVPDKALNALIIYDSIINDTEFVNINFKIFNEVVITKSNVSGLILSNSLFPKKIQVEAKNPNLGYTIPKGEKINNYIYFRETYRQLKIAFEKQGNRYMALIYKSKEMHYQSKELKPGWDKLLLTLNYISNNHGTSWIRAFIFTVVVSLISFWIYNNQLSSPYFYWEINYSLDDTKNAFWVGLDKFLLFWSTFPKLSIEEGDASWQQILAILCSRIFVGYGIYQFITAFRMFGKK